MNKPANGYEEFAADFLRVRGNTADRGMGVEQVRDWARRLPERATVLDLGCGSGLPLTKVLLEEGHAVFGVDASPTLVAAFRRHLPGVPVACEPVETSAFHQQRYDGVLAWGFIFLLPIGTQLTTLRHIARVLVPGGRLLFTAPAPCCTWRDALTGEESNSLGAVTYRKQLEESGVMVVREYEDEGENHYFEAIRQVPPSLEG